MKQLTVVTLAAILSTSTVFAEDVARLPIHYNADGSVDRPLNYRQWVNVGTFILPKGAVNIIDLKPAETAEALDTYVEPHTYAIYMATGVWPEGAQMVKEFTALAEPAEDGSVSESHFIGLSYIIKDSERFPDETANLGYFQFGHKRQYADTASLMPRDRCSSCHEENASDQQNIFASRHIGLKRD